MATPLTLPDLPDAVVLAHILPALSPQQVCCFACVSRWARSLADDDALWAAAARAVTGGVVDAVPLAEWGAGTTYRSLYVSLLREAGPLLAATTMAGCDANPSGTGPLAHLGALVVVVPHPPAGVTAYALTPASLSAWLRTPVFACDKGVGWAGPTLRCLRPGRPPRGRGPVPDSHPASMRRIDDSGEAGRVVPWAITCADGCRHDVVEARARLEAAAAPLRPPAGVDAAGAARLGLPDLPARGRVPDALRSLGGLRMEAHSYGREPLLLWPIRWPNHVDPALPGAALVGMWKGTYSVHGVEVVDITFHPDMSALEAVKRLGDYNVPALQTSFYIFPGGHGASGVTALRAGTRLTVDAGVAVDVDGLDAVDPPLVVDQVWPAVGRVAGAGFVDVGEVPATVATLAGPRGRDAFLMAWGGVEGGRQHISLFVRMEKGELVRAAMGM